MAVVPLEGSEAARLDPQLEAIVRDFKELYHRSEERSLELAKRQVELEHALEELHESYRQTARTLALMVEFKDETTGSHLDRTRRYGMELARRVDPRLGADPSLEYGFLLHDVGKAGIDYSILAKEGPLTAIEQERMRLHPIIGAQFLAGIKHLEGAIPIVKQHHERWDGAGYPYGLAGEEIHVGARIFSVVDAFDAMTSERPYRKAMSLDEAFDQIIRGAGTQFDPEVVSVLADMWPDLSAIHMTPSQF